jgi:hypothetical protein
MLVLEELGVDCFFTSAPRRRGVSVEAIYAPARALDA